MPLRQDIPDELKRGPITIADAERLGVSRHRLRGRSWRRVGCGAYVWAGLATDAVTELVALHRRLPPGSVFSGLTATRLHGIDARGEDVVEVAVPMGVKVNSRPGVRVHTAARALSAVTTLERLPVTTPLQTCFDLARRLPVVEAVEAVDSAVHRDLVTLHGLREYVWGQTGLKGVPQARRAIELAQPGAESPMESRLRMVLVLGGLPRPQLQVELRDAGGSLLGRPDLLYATARLAIEYDGQTHRNSLVADNRRQNRLQRAGYVLLRYTAADVYQRAEAIVAEVRAFLEMRNSSSPAAAHSQECVMVDPLERRIPGNAPFHTGGVIRPGRRP